MKVTNCTIGDVCEVFDGPHATPSPSDEGPVYLGIPSILDDGSIDYENSKRISWEEFPKWAKRVTPQPGDVVFSYEANLDTYAIIPEGFVGCLGRRMAIMRPNKDKILSRYLYYYMLSPQWKAVIASKTVLGATVNRIPIATYPDFPIAIPDLETQQRIAGALSAYDELIENNRKQIKLLEEAAQRLYKDWFVDLNFPGHETTSIHNGLPDGWKRICLGELLSSHIGGGWGKDTCDADYSVGALVVRATDIEDIRNGITSNVPLRWHLKSNYSSRHLEVGDIVFEVSGGSKEKGVGRSLLVTNEYLALLGAPTICASFCKRMHLETYTDSLYLYWTIQHDLALGAIRKYEKSSAGNIINFLWKEFLESYEIALPNEETRLAFEATAGPLTTGIGECSQQVSAAREARDRLLPRLISGEIEG